MTPYDTGIILCMCLANERCCCNIKASLIGWCICKMIPIVHDIESWLGGVSVNSCHIVSSHCYKGNWWSVQYRQWWKKSHALRWRHNDQDGVSNHQPHGCLLNRLFRCRSNKTSKLRVTGLCVGNSPGPVNSPHKGPVTRKVFPFDDVIMAYGLLS